MKKKKPIPWPQIGLAVVLGFAWSKLGLGAAFKAIPPQVFRKEYPPKSETGHMGQAEWQAKYGGSQLDYEDWLKGV